VSLDAAPGPPDITLVLESEATIRLAVFIGVLALLVVLERAMPWRVARPLGPRRWLHNIGLLASGSVLVRVLVPAAAMGAAFWAEARGIGLLHWLAMPWWVTLPVAVVLLDLLIYLQHRVFHAVPWLWRLHRVHHADTEMDATTGLRFHPLEILLSVFIKIAAAVVFGIPPEAMLAFEVLLNASSMFEHAAITLPPRLDAALRWVIVTPSLHRIHHSERREETDSNFGFNLSVWDRIFGTLREHAQGTLRLGIGMFGAARDQRLDQLLVQPFRKSPARVSRGVRVRGRPDSRLR
jgi:sterol desaturase/sphingolipid hydroxylase (fatty acid hydroxylase superfamily)